MNASYRLGFLIVLITVAVAAPVARRVPFRATAPAAEDLAGHPYPLGSFRLTDQAGQPRGDRDLADRVWVASFVFTRCPASCPKISAVMHQLQDRLEKTGVRLVSISVDPEHDTPAVLDEYARRFGARPGRWSFLTGPETDVYNLILDRFHLDVARRPSADAKGEAEAVSHTGRLALVGRGNRVLGTFDSQDPEAVDRLVARARVQDLGWVLRLPAINAALNATCAALLVAGWVLIRRGFLRAHTICMASGVAVSALFLASYLVYHYHVGSVPFRGVGPVRVAYFTVLLSHTVLAVVVVPLILAILTLAIRSRFTSHARIARVTLPIWLYVSITGVVVYLMLYHLDVTPSLA